MAEKQLKSTVVSYRVCGTVSEAMDKQIGDKPIWGIKSKNLLARKLLLDFYHGKLVYKKKDDAEKNTQEKDVVNHLSAFKEKEEDKKE